MQNNRLSFEQLEIVRKIQKEILHLAKRIDMVNAAITSNNLSLRLLSMPTLGLLVHDIEGVLFEHDRAVTDDVMRNRGMIVPDTLSVMPEQILEQIPRENSS